MYPVNKYSPIRDSTVVSIPACRVGDPGSIPGLGVFYCFPFVLKIKKIEKCITKLLDGPIVQRLVFATVHGEMGVQFPLGSFFSL